jgi:aromatic-L-amino-acid decarboxylase
MPPDEFRRYGYQLIDWVAEYLANTRKYPVMPAMKPGELVDRLPASAPEQGEPMERILRDFETEIVPALNHWNHPRFHAYFSVSASAPGILAELLIAATNTNGMVWQSCPGNVELEQVTLGWLRQWVGLPETFFGVIHDTASLSTAHAIAAARQAADHETRDRGARPGMVLYTSAHAHSSVEKGAMSLGLGRRHVRKIDVDAAYRMRPEALAAAIAEDRRAGLRPFCVVSTAGTTTVSSIDPVPAIQEIAAREGLWHHVDAAYGGPAAIVPEFRWVLEGAGHADSIVLNPHKWLFTPIDCSCFYTRRPEAFRDTFSLTPEYLRSSEDPRAVNYMDYTINLGRRFRALKLWFILRYFGRERIVEVLRAHIRWAQELAAAIAADSRFEVAAPHPLSLVCFRLRGSDAANHALVDAINNSGTAFLAGNVLDGRYVIRFAIGNLGTTREDVMAVWDKLREAASYLAVQA